MMIPAELLVLFPPSADLLLDHACRHTDDAMLSEIARIDYGWKTDEMIAELRPIRDMRVIPALMSGQLREVLGLTRYSDPDRPNPPPLEPGPSGQSRHQTRLFACTVLLRTDAEGLHEGFDTSPDSTLAQCLLSVNALGEATSRAAARFLTWRMTRLKSGPEFLLSSLALLILAIRLHSGRLTEPIFERAGEWILAQKSFEKRQFSWNSEDPRPQPFSIQTGLWEPLAAELRKELEALDDDELRIKLQLCALLLDPD